MSDEDIEQQVQEWSANSTECFHILLRQGDRILEEFNPAFTYSIFGDEESIFGYRNLEINLSFAAHNLRPHLELVHNGIFPDQGDVKASDIKGAIADFLIPEAITDTSVLDALHDSDAAIFQPPGNRLHTYERNGDAYEIWSAPLSDAKALEVFKNMQIFAPLMVEGATILELDYDWVINRWRLFLLYKIVSADSKTSKYALAGYGTTYRIFTLPERSPVSDKTSTPAELEAFKEALNAIDRGSIENLCSRERLSQFIILPPFQRSGHGAHLYNTIYAELTAPSNVCEMTVEDPNENFDILRDLCDLRRLRATCPAFASLAITDALDSADVAPNALIPLNKMLSESATSELKRSTKLAPRQFSRLVELQTLSQIPASNRKLERTTRRERASNPHDRAYYFWRLYTKHRLFQFNRDVLLQIDDRAERVEKLDQALASLQAEYEGILAAAAAATPVEEKTRESVTAGKDGDGTFTSGNENGSRKRGRVLDDDEDEAGTESLVNGRKRARVMLDDDEAQDDGDGEDAQDDRGEDIGDAST